MQPNNKLLDLHDSTRETVLDCGVIVIFVPFPVECILVIEQYRVIAIAVMCADFPTLTHVLQLRLDHRVLTWRQQT